MAEYKKTLVVFTSLSSMRNVMPRLDRSPTTISPVVVLSDKIKDFEGDGNLVYRVVKKGEIERVDKIELNGVYLVRDSIDAEAFSKVIESLDDEKKEQVHVLYHENQGGGGFDNEMLQGFNAYLGQHTYGPTYGYPSFLKALSELGDNQECRGNVVDKLIEAAFCYNARMDIALDFLHKCLTELESIRLDDLFDEIEFSNAEQAEIKQLFESRAKDDQWLRKVRDIVLAKVMHA